MYVEAENLQVTVDGETIMDVEVNIGYIHRGVEALMQKRNYIQNIYLAERICGICSGIHTVTYCQMVENLMNIDIPERARYIRTIILELERLHSHLLYLGVMGYEMGLDTIFMFSWKDREYVMEILEEISGNRVNYAMNTIGGVRRDISTQKIPEFLKKIDKIDKQARYYKKIFTSDRAVLARTRNIGILKKSDVEKYSVLGPVARASDVSYDMRKISPYAAYESLENVWSVITEKAGDVRARVMVKIREINEAVKILKHCFKNIPKTPIKKQAPFVVPPDEAISRTEAPRGELIYYGISNGTDKPERVRVRTPSYTNMISLRPMLLKQQLADLPVIVGSIDPCFSCTDRITLIDQNTWERKTVTPQDLKKLDDAE